VLANQHVVLYLLFGCMCNDRGLWREEWV
jgi:hypothetical protein